MIYRYSINGTSVSPLNAGTHVYKFDLINNSGFVYDKQIDEPFLFSYTDNFDFKGQEGSDLCEELQFLIERKCGGVWATWWQGVFAITEGEFDDNKCVYKILPRIISFLVDDIDINLFDVPGVVSVSNGLVGAANRIYANGRNFADVILYLARKGNANITGVVSNFFQINPLVVSSDCIPGVPSSYEDMVYFAVSDIQEPIPSDLATREYITFKKIMDDLRAILNVHWFVDSTTFALRIEHEIFFNGSIGIDFTLPEYEQYIKGRTRYSYDLKEFPKKETWKFVDNPFRLTLTYAGLSSIGKRQGEKIYQSTITRTGYGANAQSEGVFLMPTNGSGVLVTQFFTVNYLVRYLHCYNRPSLYAVFEYVLRKQVIETGGFVLQSLVRGMVGEELNIPLCCSDTFNAEDLITTPLGIGKVAKAEFNQKNSILNVSLKYPISNCDDFDPSSISGMSLWLKHGVGITFHPGGTGTRVAQWDDQSGNNNHAVNAVSADSPEYISGAPMMFLAAPSPPLGTFLLTQNNLQVYPAKRGTVIILVGRDYNNVFSGGANAPSTGNGPLKVPLSGTNGIPILSTNTGFGPNATDFDIHLDDQLYYSRNHGDILYPQLGTQSNFSNNSLGMNGLFIIRRGTDTSLYTEQNGLPSTNNNQTILNFTPNNVPLRLGFNPVFANQSGTLFLNEVMIFDRELTNAEIDIITFYFIKTGYFPTFES